MRLKSATVGLLAFIGLAGGAEAVNPVASANRGGTPPSNAALPAPRGAPVILYSQLDNPSGNGVPDQNFEASFDAYDSEAADDFVVPAGQAWIVEQVRTVGTTGTPGGSTVRVNFHADAATFPGAIVPGCSYTGIVPIDTAGSLTINLPTGCTLSSGTYWVAIQVTQSFASFGQHFWSNRSTQSNSGSAWRNPGDGFATGCTNWNRQTICGVGGGASPDLLFELQGDIGGADISLAVTDTPDPVPAGSNLTYAMTATNNGPNPAGDVSIQLTMAPGTTYVSAAPSAGGLCGTQPAVGGNGLVVCSWAGPTAVGAGAARTVNVVVGVPGNTPNATVLNAVGGSTTTSADPVPANNGVNIQTTVIGAADLALTLTDAPDPVTAGGGPGVGQITYTATILNNGPAPAQDVAISLPTAAGTTFISATPGAGGVCGTQPAVGASGALSCTWAGATAAAASRVLTVVVGVPANTANGTIFNVTGTASSPTVDLTPANNTASTTTTVQTSADLAITLTDTPDPVIAGNNLTYNVTVTNNGPSDAQGAGFSLPLPAATTFVSLTATGGTCTNPAVGSGGTVSCTWAGATAPTVSRTATVVARVLPSTAAGNISATATTATTTTDPTAANNTATATTTVQVSADLSIALTVVPTQGPTGTLVNVTATVTNNGPSDAQNVQAAVTLPQPVNIVSSSGGAGGTCATTGSGTNNIVTCTWSGATAPTATRVATIQAVIALNASGVITAVASSPTTDPATPNNTATATVAGVPVVQGIPTMDRIGLILLGGLLLGLGIVAVRRA